MSARRSITTAARTSIQRTKFERDPFDYYQESSWVSERLFEVERFRAVLDPSCGSARMVKNAWNAGLQAIGSDITAGEGRDPNFLGDFLSADYAMPEGDWDIVSNPPFKHCLDRREVDPETGRKRWPFLYIRRALERTRRKVALLLPADYLTGDRRQAFLKETPLARVYYLSPRPWCGPAHIPEAERAQGFTDLIWLVWDKQHSGSWTGLFLNRDGQRNGAKRKSSTPP